MNNLRVPIDSSCAPARTYERAFTRTELLLVIAVVILLAAVVLPALASNRSRSDRVVCLNNLRQIGLALQVWGNDHGDRIPWHVPPADGGTRLHPLSANTWLQFAWLSNELASPKLAFCPSDSGRFATDFTGDPSHGYIHPNFANRATSYFINAHPYGELAGNQMLAGDRNIPMQGNSSCWAMTSLSWAQECPAWPSMNWTNGLHGSNVGTLLMFDGQVVQANGQKLRSAFEYICYFGGSVGSTAHISIPR